MVVGRRGGCVEASARVVTSLMVTMMVVTSGGPGVRSPGQASHTEESSICGMLVGSCHKLASISSQIFPLSPNLAWLLITICSVSHKNFLSRIYCHAFSNSPVFTFISESS